MQKAFNAAIDRSQKLPSLYDPVPNKILLDQCFEEVLAEIQVGRLWMPSVQVDKSVESQERIT